MGENVWDFRKRLTLLLASAVIIAVVFFIFKVLFYYVWPFLLAFCFAVLLQKPIEIVCSNPTHINLYIQVIKKGSLI